MKVVFLDVDGVLNHNKTPERKIGAYGLGGVIGVDPEKVVLLKEIIEATGAEIIVSSSWRYSESDMQELREALAAEGLSIRDTTPILKGEPRGKEIMEWLSAFPEVSKYVILDDESDMLDVKDHLIQTSFLNGGLGEQHVKEAIHSLN